MSQSLSKLVDDVQNASPVTLALLATFVAYILLALYWAVLKPVGKSIGWLLPRRANTRDSQTEGATKKGADTPLTFTPRGDNVACGVASDKRTKGLKQLLKESKQAAASAHSHEKIPDTELYLNTLRGHGDTVVSVEVSSDDSTIITASEDKVVRVFDMKGDFANTKPSLLRVPLKETPIRAMFWGGNENIAACTAGLGQVANLFTVKGIKQGRAVPTPEKVADRLHDGAEVAKSCSIPSSVGGQPLLATLTRTKEGKVTAGDGKVLATVQPSGINNYHVTLSKDGRFMAVTTWACDAKIWELKWGRDGSFQGCTRAMELKGHTSGILSIAFNNDATCAATASKDGTLRIWMINVRYELYEDPKCILTSRLSGKPYEHLTWCGNGVLAGAQGPTLHFLDAGTGRLLESIPEAHAKPITSVCTVANAVQCGKLKQHVVVTGGKDHKARIWIAPTPVVSPLAPRS